MNLPSTHHKTTIVQTYGNLVDTRIGLATAIRHKSVAALNRMLAHTLALRDLYKKCHWQTYGATFYQLHLLFDKHAAAQADLADTLAERVQTLGGVAIALGHDVAEESQLARAPRDREDIATELNRLVNAHELILQEARVLAKDADERGDVGSADVLVSQVVRTNELQSWFVTEHLVTAGATK